jgi:hypothetical protein
MGLTDIERHLLKGGTTSPDLSTLPTRVPRDVAADLLRKFFFEVSPRSLERWPLGWRRLNGKAHCETAELFAVAEQLLAEAPVIRGGRAKVLLEQAAS